MAYRAAWWGCQGTIDFEAWSQVAGEGGGIHGPRDWLRGKEDPRASGLGLWMNGGAVPRATGQEEQVWERKGKVIGFGQVEMRSKRVQTGEERKLGRGVPLRGWSAFLQASESSSSHAAQSWPFISQRTIFEFLLCLGQRSKPWGFCGGERQVPAHLSSQSLSFPPVNGCIHTSLREF